MEEFNTLNDLAKDLRDNKLKPIECTDCKVHKRDKQCEKCKERKKYLLLFAYNRVGKTRLSMEFKELGKNRGSKARDTLYFNAFTEDLFPWHNDLDGDTYRYLEMKTESRFFDGFKRPDIRAELEEKILIHLARYADFKFEICCERFLWVLPKKWRIVFLHEGKKNIKISRGEQSIFIWCFFLAIVEFVLDGKNPYENINYLYIDDPISSLDDGNAIAVATDLATLLQKKENKKTVRTVISSHHGLFSNVLCNNFRRNKGFGQHFLTKHKDPERYTLRGMSNTPFSYHLVMLNELQEILDDDGKPFYPYHLNILRVILEKTAIFLGFNSFSKCVNVVCCGKDSNDKDFIIRALHSYSHGACLTDGPDELSAEHRECFKRFIIDFKAYYHFNEKNLSNDPD